MTNDFQSSLTCSMVDGQLDFAESVGWLAPGDRAAVKEGKRARPTLLILILILQPSVYINSESENESESDCECECLSMRSKPPVCTCTCTTAHVQEVSAHADAHPDGESHPHATHGHTHSGAGTGTGVGAGLVTDVPLPRIKGALSPPRKLSGQGHGQGQGQGASAARGAVASRGGTQPNKVNMHPISYFLIQTTSLSFIYSFIYSLPCNASLLLSVF